MQRRIIALKIKKLIVLHVIILGTADMCSCMPVNQCGDFNAITYAGTGILDPRFGPCQSATLVCCRLVQTGRADLNIVTPDLEPAAPMPACGLKDRTYFKGILREFISIK